jgi:hypothetical protein
MKNGQTLTEDDMVRITKNGTILKESLSPYAPLSRKILNLVMAVGVIATMFSFVGFAGSFITKSRLPRSLFGVGAGGAILTAVAFTLSSSLKTQDERNWDKAVKDVLKGVRYEVIPAEKSKRETNSELPTQNRKLFRGMQNERDFRERSKMAFRTNLINRVTKPNLFRKARANC